MTRWPGSLLLVVALTTLAGRAGADVRIANEEPPAPQERPSHKPIGNGLENDLTPEQRLSNRLQKARQQRDVQNLAKKLLDDPEMMQSLLKSLSKDDLDRLKDTVKGNRDLGNDPALKQMFEESLKNQKLSDQDRELIQKWKETASKSNVPPTPQPRLPNQPQPGQPPQAQPPTGVPRPGETPGSKQPPRPDNLPAETPEWVKKNLNDSAKDFSRWLDSPSGKSFRDGLKDFGKDLGKRAGDMRNSQAGERMRGTSKYLPKPGEWISNVRPRSTPRVGSLPRMSAPSGSVPRVSAGGLFQFIVVALAIGLLLFILWKSRGLFAAAIARVRAGGWKLGPWPVRPDQVKTRGDLVRAFEHLALMCLGLPARTHHHLDLGRLIGEQASPDPDRRRDAAQTLARLYEQARYTPDDEPLSPQDVASARRELGHLAGEMAA